MKTSWIRLSSLSSEDVLGKTNEIVLAIRIRDVFKKFSKRLQDVLQKHLQDVLKTSSKCLQDIFKTSSKHPQVILKNVFKVLKTSSRYFQDLLHRYLQDAFKTYHQVKLFLLTRLWEAFDTFLRWFFSKDGYLQRDMRRQHYSWWIYDQRTKFAREIKVFHCTTAFSGCLERHI